MSSESHRERMPLVLEFREACFSTGMHREGCLRGVTLELRAGDIVLVRLQEGRERTVLADAAQGLLGPDSGTVLFMREDWSTMTPARQSEQRGRIRRVFEHYGWVTNLDVSENVCLAEWHHSTRPRADIAAEADRLARSFGLDGLPEGRPTRVHPMTLRRLEWVRALMGTPVLILLERPLMGAPKGEASRLIEAMSAAAGRGVAVLWMTDDDRVWGCPALTGARRFCMVDETLTAV